ncbi:pentapeptide repeat-containing protein [Clostridium cylindrosporum]|uniref:Pentapeptide repeat protein n=1 Tax=Clostridium cylindrosporum DSM 605 TaxID=1121307 RepID=A0A0J8DB68_CLOCY|nr:pentapeptide repeat-containing protein [Clostridium cylindrosporum]KMT23320.1 pentapeptide repeat protein [Clostridium cylindrosporum DSM 605]
MIDNSKINVIKPKSIWKKPVDIRFKDLFITLSKGLIHGVTQNWTEVSTDVADALASIGLETTPGEKAWKLVYKSVTKALFSIIEDNESLLKTKQINSSILIQDVTEIFEDEITIDNTFFDSPKEANIVKIIQEMLSNWLMNCGFNQSEMESICNRFPSYFVYALNNEWRENYSEYSSILENTTTPFSLQAEIEKNWAYYYSQLNKELDEPLFLEAFSLMQIYVPLNGYYRNKVAVEQNKRLSLVYTETEVYERVVVDLEEEIDNWIENSEKEDALRVICGGPGCGKSTFAKKIASVQSSKSDLQVLFIPLHHFELKDDLVDAVNSFILYEGILKHKPLDIDNGEKRLLIIFDGLDELALQGKFGMEASQQFIQEVQQKLYNFNMKQLRLQIIITGRDLIIQSNQCNIRKDRQVLHILPYYISHKKMEKKYTLHKEGYTYVDDKALLKKDLRHEWWRKYGSLTGKGYTQMPKELSLNKLDEITSQPLLNYLVALSYERKQIDFTIQSNLNEIYGDLIKNVYDRDWDSGIHRSLQNVTYDQFVRVLEEIALATWHGDGRTTTVKEIEEHCDSSGLKSLLLAFQEGASKGVTRLLTAFYFRQSNNQMNNDKTFEFTHKSFGEYLTAKRIILGIDIISGHIEKKQKNPDYGWDEKEALKNWIQLCGSTTMDEYVFSFIEGEMKLINTKKIKGWHKTLLRLLSYSLKNGLPFEILHNRPNYKDEMKQEQNSIESLLLVICKCADLGNVRTKITHPSPTSFGELLARVQGQRIGPKNRLISRCFVNMDLDGIILDARDFCRVSFQGLNIRESKLKMSNMLLAEFYNCNLNKSNFIFSSFHTCTMDKVNAKNAKFINADFSSSYIMNVDFTKSTFRKADFSDAVLKNVKFVGAELQEVSFNNAKLVNVVFDNAIFDYKLLIGASYNGNKITENNFNKFQQMRNATIEEVSVTEID